MNILMVVVLKFSAESLSILGIICSSARYKNSSPECYTLLTNPALRFVIIFSRKALLPRFLRIHPAGSGF
jgi:hypothetical protein